MSFSEVGGSDTPAYGDLVAEALADGLHGGPGLHIEVGEAVPTGAAQGAMITYGDVMAAASRVQANGLLLVASDRLIDAAVSWQISRSAITQPELQAQANDHLLIAVTAYRAALSEVEGSSR